MFSEAEIVDGADSYSGEFIGWRGTWHGSPYKIAIALPGPKSPIQRVHHGAISAAEARFAARIIYIGLIAGRRSRRVQNYKLFLLCGCTMC